MLTANAKAALSTLVSGVRHALKKGAALRAEMTKLQKPEDLISFVEDCRAEVKETVKDKELAARAMALVSTIASQVRRDKDWPKVRKAGAGRKAADKSEEQDKDAGKESAVEGISAAVAYIVRRHKEVTGGALLGLLAPLADLLRRTYTTDKPKEKLAA